MWIILGERNTRKGSVIRSLTGVGQSRWCEVALPSDPRLRLWAQVRSLNEGNCPPAKSVEDCLEDGANQPLWSWYNLQIPLQLDTGKSGFEAQDYVAASVKAEARIESIVMFDEATRFWALDCRVSYGEVLNASVPRNEIGAKVRRFSRSQ